jgi:hypothetical protein
MMENTLRVPISIPETISPGNGTGSPMPVSKSGERYQWRWVNFSRFLYDEIEDLYIPEVVYNNLFKS